MFDSNRCTGCQACAAACGKGRRSPLPAAGPVTDERSATVADGYVRTADLDGQAVLAVTFRERAAEGGGTVWELGRKSCVHCAAAPCAEVCPTGALALDGETGLVLANHGRCVSCFLCSLACPIDVPRPGGAGGAVAKCDGCVDRVRADQAPLCVEACPLEALQWGDREEMIAQANDRVARLQERGFKGSCVLGVSEQGGHGVIQVLKYGVAGSDHAPLAATGETPWIAGAKMAGPVSVGVVGALGVAAVGALAWETRKEQQARAAAKAAPIGVVPGIAAAADGFDGAAAGAGDGEDGAYLDGAFTDEDAVRAAEERAAAEARETAARASRIVAPTPAAAAAATAAERHLYPVAFDEGELAGEDAEEPLIDELGDTGEIPLIVVDEKGDTGEIPVVDEKSDTGELYDVEDFRRLLAADLVAHHLAKKDAQGDEPESDADLPAGSSVDDDVPVDGAYGDGAPGGDRVDEDAAVEDASNEDGALGEDERAQGR